MLGEAPIDQSGWRWEAVYQSDGLSAVALAIHAWALPTLFCAALILHIAAALKRDFADRAATAVRRMLR